MEVIKFSSEYFNATDTLDCGQIFRYKLINGKYLVVSGDKACFIKTDGETTVVECEDGKYFRNFFDLDRDYGSINQLVKGSKYEIVAKSADRARGIRILNQQREEMLFSFIISQNNMIPRIKAIIERTCETLGQKRTIDGYEYYSFPSAEILAKCDEEFYKSLGYGYRARYMVEVSNAIVNGEINLDKIANLPTEELKKCLVSLKGVGGKVADCIALFGYHRVDSFPVDTWIERLYKEDFKGELADRKKITEWFLNEFRDNSGYVQQYLFYYKRSLVKNERG